MTKIDRVVHDAFNDIKIEIEFLKDHIYLYRDLIERSLVFELDMMLLEFEYLALANLQDYERTDAKKRSKIVEEALEVIEQLVSNYTFNRKGSFTQKGAKRAFKRDVEIGGGKRRKEIIVSGKLKELEEGETNWNGLRGFLYAMRPSVEKIKGKEDTKRFYQDLARLFRTAKTTPRLYLTKAAEDARDSMHESVMESIDEFFEGKGSWSNR